MWPYGIKCGNVAMWSMWSMWPKNGQFVQKKANVKNTNVEKANVALKRKTNVAFLSRKAKKSQCCQKNVEMWPYRITNDNFEMNGQCRTNLSLH